MARPYPSSIFCSAWRRALSIAWLALTAAGAAGAQPPAEPVVEEVPLPIGAEWRLERLADEAEVAPGATVRVVQLYGDLRVRPTDGRSVEVSATVQLREGDPEPPELRLQKSGDGLVVEAAFHETDDPRVEEYAAIHPRRRIDLVVFLPEASPLVATTRDGLLEVKGVSNDLVLETESGPIVARSKGSIRARSDRGSVYVVLQGTDWTTTPAVETVTGDIRLELPPTADARITAVTAAEITTDFSVEIDRPDDGRRKRAVALLGRASREIDLTSQMGNIKLLEYPYPTAEPAPNKEVP